MALMFPTRHPVRIVYKAGYKYQLHQDYSLFVPFTPDKAIVSRWICLREDGLIWIKKGYAWDGPSGPAIDSKNFMRGSLIHDALYQLMAEHGLDSGHRGAADQFMRAICREDGMSPLRAWWVYMGVKTWGGIFVASHNPVLYAP